MGMQRHDNEVRLKELENEEKEIGLRSAVFRYSMGQAQVLLEKTLEYEQNLEQQVEDVEQDLIEERKETARINRKLYEEKQGNSAKRKKEKEKLMAERSQLEELEEAAEKWNNNAEDDDEGCCMTYCECLMELPIPTVLRVCYGLYTATGVLTLILGAMVHSKIGYIQTYLTMGVAGTGMCMIVLGGLTVLTVGVHNRWWVFFLLLLLNVLQRKYTHAICLRTACEQPVASKPTQRPVSGPVSECF